MKIAYIILAHKNPTHLRRLVDKLTYEGNYFFIHVDLKSNIEHFIRMLPSTDKVRYVKNRVVIFWGDFNIVQGTLNLIKEVKASDIKFDYVCLLSGQDYPIKSNEFIRDFFDKNREKSFMTYHPLPYSKLNYGGMHRINSYTFTIRGRKETYLPKIFPNNFNFKGKVLNHMLGAYCFFKKKRFFPSYLKPYYGSQWWNMDMGSIDYVLAFLERKPDYVTYHRHTLLPDEIFFQSILANTNDQWKKRPVNNNLRYILWKENESSPEILKIKDLTSILASESLFARKFDEQSEGLLEALDRLIIS